eukprot:353435-Chlamydomonas_euryale.AAC.11
MFLAVQAASRGLIPCCLDALRCPVVHGPIAGLSGAHGSVHMHGCSERIRELALSSRVVCSRSAPRRAPNRAATRLILQSQHALHAC